MAGEPDAEPADLFEPLVQHAAADPAQAVAGLEERAAQAYDEGFREGLGGTVLRPELARALQRAANGEPLEGIDVQNAFLHGPEVPEARAHIGRARPRLRRLRDARSARGKPGDRRGFALTDPAAARRQAAAPAGRCRRRPITY